MPRTEPRHAKLSACATCQAAHRGGEPPRAVARRREPGGWGAPRAVARRRAQPPCGTRGGAATGTGGGKRCKTAREGARNAKPRTAPMARRRDGDIAPYRQAARAVRTATGRIDRNRDNARSPSRTRGAHGDGHGRGARCKAAREGARRGGNAQEKRGA